MGSELYALPSDFIKLDLVQYDGSELMETTRKKTRENNKEIPSGTPTHYYLYANKLGVFPIPDAEKELNLHYFSNESTIDEDTESALPDICDDAILLRAAYKLYL